MRPLTTEELQMLEKKASKVWYKFTDHGTQINGSWLQELDKLTKEYETVKEKEQ